MRSVIKDMGHDGRISNAFIALSSSDQNREIAIINKLIDVQADTGNYSVSIFRSISNKLDDSVINLFKDDLGFDVKINFSSYGYIYTFGWTKRPNIESLVIKDNDFELIRDAFTAVTETREIVIPSIINARYIYASSCGLPTYYITPGRLGKGIVDNLRLKYGLTATIVKESLHACMYIIQ